MRIALVLLLCSSLSTAAAHGTADNHLQLVVVGSRVKMNIGVDMRVLSIVDDDRDGYAGLDELASARERFDRWLGQALKVSNERGSVGDVVFADVTSDLEIAEAHGDRVDHARVLRTLAFAERPRALLLDLTGLQEIVPDLRVTVVNASSGKVYRLREFSEVALVPIPHAVASSRIE